MPLFDLGPTGLVPVRRLDPTAEDYDDTVEDALCRDPEAVSGERLFVVRRRPSLSGGGRPALVALDQAGGIVIGHVRGSVDRNDLAECLEYMGWARASGFDEVAGLYADGPEAFRRDWHRFTGGPEPLPLRRVPRLLVVAGDVDGRTASTFAFLVENGVSVALVRVTLLAAGDRHLFDVQRGGDRPAAGPRAIEGVSVAGAAGADGRSGEETGAEAASRRAAASAPSAVAPSAGAFVVGPAPDGDIVRTAVPAGSLPSVAVAGLEGATPADLSAAAPAGEPAHRTVDGSVTAPGPDAGYPASVTDRGDPTADPQGTAPDGADAAAAATDTSPPAADPADESPPPLGSREGSPAAAPDDEDRLDTAPSGGAVSDEASPGGRPDGAPADQVPDAVPPGGASDEASAGQMPDEIRAGQASDDVRAGQASDEIRAGQASDDVRAGQVPDGARPGGVSNGAVSGGVFSAGRPGEPAGPSAAPFDADSPADVGPSHSGSASSPGAVSPSGTEAPRAETLGGTATHGTAPVTAADSEPAGGPAPDGTVAESDRPGPDRPGPDARESVAPADPGGTSGSGTTDGSGSGTGAGQSGLGPEDAGNTVDTGAQRQDDEAGSGGDDAAPAAGIPSVSTPSSDPVRPADPADPGRVYAPWRPAGGAARLHEEPGLRPRPHDEPARPAGSAEAAPDGTSSVPAPSGRADLPTAGPDRSLPEDGLLASGPAAPEDVVASGRDGSPAPDEATPASFEAVPSLPGAGTPPSSADGPPARSTDGAPDEGWTGQRPDPLLDPLPTFSIPDDDPLGVNHLLGMASDAPDLGAPVPRPDEDAGSDRRTARPHFEPRRPRAASRPLPPAPGPDRLDLDPRRPTFPAVGHPAEAAGSPTGPEESLPDERPRSHRGDDGRPMPPRQDPDPAHGAGASDAETDVAASPLPRPSSWRDRPRDDAGRLSVPPPDEASAGSPSSRFGASSVDSQGDRSDRLPRTGPDEVRDRPYRRFDLPSDERAGEPARGSAPPPRDVGSGPEDRRAPYPLPEPSPGAPSGRRPSPPSWGDGGSELGDRTPPAWEDRGQDTGGRRFPRPSSWEPREGGAPDRRLPPPPSWEGRDPDAGDRPVPPPSWEGRGPDGDDRPVPPPSWEGRDPGMGDRPAPPPSWEGRGPGDRPVPPSTWRDRGDDGGERPPPAPWDPTRAGPERPLPPPGRAGSAGRAAVPPPDGETAPRTYGRRLPSEDAGSRDDDRLFGPPSGPPRGHDPYRGDEWEGRAGEDPAGRGLPPDRRSPDRRPPGDRPGAARHGHGTSDGDPDPADESTLDNLPLTGHDGDASAPTQVPGGLIWDSRSPSGMIHGNGR